MLSNCLCIGTTVFEGNRIDLRTNKGSKELLDSFSKMIVWIDAGYSWYSYHTKYKTDSADSDSWNKRTYIPP